MDFNITILFNRDISGNITVTKDTDVPFNQDDTFLPSFPSIVELTLDIDTK